MNTFTRGAFELAMTILGIATLTLLINRSSDTQRVVSSIGGTFNDLLRTVTLQGGSGVSWGQH